MCSDRTWKKFVVMLGLLLTFSSVAWAIDPWSGPTRKAPRHGMTRAEALDYYGEPYRRVVSGQDELWYYRLKFSEVYGKAWVPFEFDGDNVRLGSITFGLDGKIRCYDWTHAVARKNRLARPQSVMMSLYVPPAGIIGRTCSV